MNRNGLVVESLRKPAAPSRSVWSMSLAMLGAAFGAPVRKDPGR